MTALACATVNVACMRVVRAIRQHDMTCWHMCDARAQGLHCACPLTQLVHLLFTNCAVSVLHRCAHAAHTFSGPWRRRQCVFLATVVTPRPEGPLRKPGWLLQAREHVSTLL